MPTQIDPPMPALIADSVSLTEDAVLILDRRCYPFERRFERCGSYEDVARAIEDMVTQSGGPFFAASAGMVLAGRQADILGSADDRRTLVGAAAARLIATRPTNNHISVVVTRMLQVAEAAVAAGDPVGPALEAAMHEAWDAQHEHSRALGAHAAELIDDGDVLLTHCWGESALVETVAAVLRQGKKLRAICTETRPYLQGARLTAESLAEMGIETRLITDNMGADVMSRGMVNKYVTAADRVTMDGHVINKVGTLQLAIAAHAFGVPYIALVRAPDRAAPDPSHVPIEERDGDEVLHCLGMRTASDRVAGFYPAFDVTPPRFVSTVVTERGRFSPHDLASHYAPPATPSA